MLIVNSLHMNVNFFLGHQCGTLRLYILGMYKTQFVELTT